MVSKDFFAVAVKFIPTDIARCIWFGNAICGLGGCSYDKQLISGIILGASGILGVIIAIVDRAALQLVELIIG